MKEKMTDEEFYKRCSELLGVKIEYQLQKKQRKVNWTTGQIYETQYKSRWFGREPGNGRIPGYGLIRIFNENLIHMSLTKPESVCKIFASKIEVLEFLSKYKAF